MSFSSGIFSPRMNDSFEISNYILDFCIVAIPSNSICSMSKDSLADSVAEMLLNCVGLTPLKMALRAFQLLDNCLFSYVVQSSSLLGTSFPDLPFLVGGVHPV